MQYLYGYRVSNMKLNSIFVLFVIFLLGNGCVETLQHVSESFPKEGAVAFGRIKVISSGSMKRWYDPEVRFIELRDQSNDRRFQLEIESAQSLFAFSLPEGKYQITRVQIREGGFRGMAELSASFTIAPEKVNYLGTWTFTVAAPYYDRDIILTVSSELIQTLAETQMTFPQFTSRSMVNNLAQPMKVRSRLFEISPYPRVRWFQRSPTG